MCNKLDKFMKTAENQTQSDCFTVRIPLSEYRDLLVSSTKQIHEIKELQFSLHRAADEVQRAKKAEDQAINDCREIRQRYSDLENWLFNNSYYADIFKNWREKHNRKTADQQFTNAALENAGEQQTSDISQDENQEEA